MKTSLLTRLGALCGALYVVVAVLANDVFGSHSPDSTATAHAIGAWWAAHPPTTADWALGMLELVALLSFAVFVVVLAWWLAQSDDGWLPWIVLAFGLLSAVIKLGSAAPIFALAWRADTGISDGLAAALVDTNAAAFVLTWALDAVMLAAAGGVILRTGTLPRWLGWSGLVSAPLVLAGVPVAISGPPTFLLALLWIVAASIALSLRTSQRSGVPTGIETRGFAQTS
jgi:hypothetical protein